MIRIPDVQSESHDIVAGDARRGFVVLGDHASNWLPESYGTLGLAAHDLERHIAYDIGADGVARGLAARLGAPAVLSRFSRLLIDPNRGDDDPTLIMRLSDGAVIPGNRHLDADERARRIARFWKPYHAAIDAVIDACLAAGVAPAILSIHSFTGTWKGVSRPWHAGILWDRDPRFALPLLEALKAEPDLVVGENEPYPGSYEGDCCWQHGLLRGLAWVVVEVRQDLIDDAAGQRRWADRLARLVENLEPSPDVKSKDRHKPAFPTQTDPAQPKKGMPP